MPRQITTRWTAGYQHQSLSSSSASSPRNSFDNRKENTNPSYKLAQSILQKSGSGLQTASTTNPYVMRNSTQGYLQPKPVVTQTIQSASLRSTPLSYQPLKSSKPKMNNYLLWQLITHLNLFFTFGSKTLETIDSKLLGITACFYTEILVAFLVQLRGLLMLVFDLATEKPQSTIFDLILASGV